MKLRVTTKETRPSIDVPFKHEEPSNIYISNHFLVQFFKSGWISSCREYSDDRLTYTISILWPSQTIRDQQTAYWQGSGFHAAWNKHNAENGITVEYKEEFVK